MNLAIKLNDSVAPRTCPLCGRITNPNVGPELTLADGMRVVCRDCGRYYAPVLAALLELAWAAEDFSLYVQEFGERCRASVEARMGIKETNRLGRA